MKFHIPNSTKEFEIPNAWWKEASMEEFVPLDRAYSVLSPPYPPDPFMKTCAPA
jgi:hypothetical protein